MADWDVYCDESADRDAVKYLVFGGVMLPRHEADRLHGSIPRWRSEVGLRDEIKWRLTRKHNVTRFKTYGGGAMHYINNGTMRFASAVFDLSDRKYYSDKTYAEDRRVKAHYFLLHCFAKYLRPDDRLFIYPDRGFVHCVPEDFIAKLNAGIAKHRRWQSASIARTIEERDSEKYDLVQMSDLLTGAVAAANINEHDLESNTGSAKQELIDYLSEHAGHEFTANTPVASTNFKIWFVKPAQKRSAGIPTDLVKPRVQARPATPP